MIYGYLCTAEATPHTNPATGVNCTYCGEGAKALKGGMYWDPKLRNLIPFTSAVRRDGTRHKFWEYHVEHCDWTTRSPGCSAPAFVPPRSPPRRRSPHPPYSNHYPLRSNLERGPPSDVVTLLRDPRRRLVSAWNNNKHSYGAGKQDWVHIRAAQTIDAFMALPFTASCQTKMMVGRTCASKPLKDPARLVEAKRRLREDIKFVGITDSFNLSVCLFHHMFGAHRATPPARPRH